MNWLHMWINIAHGFIIVIFLYLLFSRVQIFPAPVNLVLGKKGKALSLDTHVSFLDPDCSHISHPHPHPLVQAYENSDS